MVSWTPASFLAARMASQLSLDLFFTLPASRAHWLFALGLGGPTIWNSVWLKKRRRTGSAEADYDLVSEVLRLEPMVLVPSALKPFTPPTAGELPVITIESRSGAWASIEEAMRRLNIRRETSLESFFSVAQMALAGFGHGLIPRGVARTLGIPPERCIELGDRGLARPVRFVARKSMFLRPLVQSVYAALAEEAQRLDR